MELLKTHEEPHLLLDQLRDGKSLESVTASESGNEFEAGSLRSQDISRLTTSSQAQSTTSLSVQDLEEAAAESSDSAHVFSDNRRSPQTEGSQKNRNYSSAEWTAVTSNDNLVDHLLALYFCWEYPTFASLSKEHFMHDFKLGIHRFCSSLLVNAMLALGARSSDIPEARMDWSDPRTAGDHFFEEAKRLLGAEEVFSLPMIQALGLMSLRQASCGKDASSFYYARLSLRMALDIDLHLQHPASQVYEFTAFSGAEREVRMATLWGCVNLEQAWCLCIGRPSQLMPDEINIDKPKEIDEIEHEDWVPYTDAGPISQDYHQPNNVRAVYRCFSELSEIINLAVHQLYSQSFHFKTNGLLSNYYKLLEWYDALPDQLRLGLNFTPTVLFTQ